jgi:nitrate reductase NapE component
MIECHRNQQNIFFTNNGHQISPLCLLRPTETSLMWFPDVLRLPVTRVHEVWRGQGSSPIWPLLCSHHGTSCPREQRLSPQSLDVVCVCVYGICSVGFCGVYVCVVFMPDVCGVCGMCVKWRICLFVWCMCLWYVWCVHVVWEWNVCLYGVCVCVVWMLCCVCVCVRGLYISCAPESGLTLQPHPACPACQDRARAL